MIRPLIIALAVVAVVAGSTVLLRSRSSVIELSAGTAAMPSLLELHAAAAVHKLPVQDIEDQSLIYPGAEKRWKTPGAHVHFSAVDASHLQHD
jgi:hypothetical protein